MDVLRELNQAAEGERVIIKGSEEITGWNRTEDGIWKIEISNEIFNGKNPFAEKIEGDWLVTQANMKFTVVQYI